MMGGKQKTNYKTQATGAEANYVLNGHTNNYLQHQGRNHTKPNSSLKYRYIDTVS